MEELVNEYLNELFEKEEFKRLIELKKIIDTNYKKEIISFKTNESIYNEALEHNYGNNIEELRKNYINSKANLYSKKEVKEYFELERKLNEYLEKDFDDIKGSISNKLKNHYSFTCRR